MYSYTSIYNHTPRTMFTYAAQESFINFCSNLLCRHELHFASTAAGNGAAAACHMRQILPCRDSSFQEILLCQQGDFSLQEILPCRHELLFASTAAAGCGGAAACHIRDILPCQDPRDSSLRDILHCRYAVLSVSTAAAAAAAAAATRAHTRDCVAADDAPCGAVGVAVVGGGGGAS